MEDYGEPEASRYRSQTAIYPTTLIARKRLNIIRKMEDYGEPEASRHYSQTAIYPTTLVA